MSAVIKTENICKSFGNVKALDNFSFEVNENEIIGLVGPDGAGKSTAIRILTCLLKPDSGNAEIFGFNLQEEQKKIKKLLGYLSQKFSLYSDLTIDENIEFFADIHGVKDFKSRRDALLSFMRLTQFRKFQAGKLSGGMKQKLSLACTLIHKPKILFLDEPTTGVDPVSRRDFWKILSNLLKEGITILITTPYLDEAERFNRIALMDKGKILKFDTPESIKKSTGMEAIEIVCDNLRKAYSLLKEKFRFDVQLFGDRINAITKNPAQHYGEIEKLLTSNGITTQTFTSKPVSLENVFIHLLKSDR
jgi:ABC-2 type transport system ATP-binding protein